MFSTWMKLSLDAARLGYEMQTVMTLRMLKLARGGAAATTEAQRMVTEKGVAFAEAVSTLATGAAACAPASARTSAACQNPLADLKLHTSPSWGGRRAHARRVGGSARVAQSKMRDRRVG
jgi:hypothetical protein